MKEHPDTIRRNIKHYEKLLKVDHPDYTHENVRKLLAESENAASFIGGREPKGQVLTRRTAGNPLSRRSL